MLDRDKALAMLKHSDWYGEWVRVGTVAKFLAITHARAYRALEELVEMDWLRKRKIKGCNRYRANEDNRRRD